MFAFLHVTFAFLFSAFVVFFVRPRVARTRRKRENDAAVRIRACLCVGQTSFFPNVCVRERVRTTTTLKGLYIAVSQFFV